MKHLLTVLLLGVALHFPAFAYFEVEGKGIVHLKNGDSKPFTFGFSYTRRDGRNVFIVGKNSLPVQQVPQKYSLALVLHQDSYVWVNDFVDEPLIGFDFEIDGHRLKLYREDGLRERGSYVIEINGVRHHFSRNIGQINFYFKPQGIDRVEPESFIRPRSR
ncbi:hypothetical protein Q3O60_02345 [Alkalimonas collagenimarina]|uniref:DUF2846 domain-containing protein n=1 Tax=Alkalimonas collagenimarina TaxID=400390 RepID=A0ABT9GVE5_9GAMM|nr:hypothetical protein [Alkalimonas collagenimarina]MDP4535024.1 hypothetical protein [Alkalimonas collagenimarina]